LLEDVSVRATAQVDDSISTTEGNMPQQSLRVDFMLSFQVILTNFLMDQITQRGRKITN